MRLSFSIKSIGKKRPYIANSIIEIDIPASTTVKCLLEKLVAQQVGAFNQRKESPNLLSFLNEDELSMQVSTGRVSFNEQYNIELADFNKAVETVLQAFNDGLIAFFVNGNQIENISQTISLGELDSITLIRLTFLAGSIF